jgi:prevent-host-death family protein
MRRTAWQVANDPRSVTRLLSADRSWSNALARTAPCAVLPRGHIGHVEKRSFADVKAHLSEVVDQAEHRGKKVLILRHGKPAAAIVPVSVAQAGRSRRALTAEQAEKRLDELAAELGGDGGSSAVADLFEGRR